MAAEKFVYATGRRKTSSARVFMKPGKGGFTINGVAFEKYLKKMNSKLVVVQPLELTSTKSKFDFMVTVAGGGESGQAGAIRHAISRALCTAEPELRGTLKKAGFLMRDPRMVERKKYGKRKARRSGQFSKR